MKKIMALLLSVMLLASLSVSVSAGLFDVELPSYEAAYGSPVIDGVVDEGEWDAALEVEMATLGNADAEQPEIPKMRIMHDGTYMYVLIKTISASPKDNNAFVCVHVPHDNCTLDGCESHIKFVIDGEALLNSDPHTDYKPWTYQKDEDFDGICDYCAINGESCQGFFSELGVASYGEFNEYIYIEIKVAANYGEALPAGEARVDVRIDDDSMHTSYMWANQERSWAPGFNPETEGGTVTFLAEGEKPTEPQPIIPEETEPTETEPVENEPKDTEKADEPKDTEKADTPNTDATDKEAPTAASFPIVPVVIAAVALIAIVIVVIMLAKKKKK